jgi:hypothetical protein
MAVGVNVGQPVTGFPSLVTDVNPAGAPSYLWGHRWVEPYSVQVGPGQTVQLFVNGQARMSYGAGLLEWWSTHVVGFGVTL